VARELVEWEPFEGKGKKLAEDICKFIADHNLPYTFNTSTVLHAVEIKQANY
jgi:hypothetical protein